MTDPALHCVVAQSRSCHPVYDSFPHLFHSTSRKRRRSQALLIPDTMSMSNPLSDSVARSSNGTFTEFDQSVLLEDYYKSKGVAARPGLCLGYSLEWISKTLQGKQGEFYEKAGDLETIERLSKINRKFPALISYHSVSPLVKEIAAPLALRVRKDETDPVGAYTWIREDNRFITNKCEPFGSLIFLPSESEDRIGHTVAVTSYIESTEWVWSYFDPNQGQMTIKRPFDGKICGRYYEEMPEGSDTRMMIYKEEADADVWFRQLLEYENANGFVRRKRIDVCPRD
ncbi:uncharacterized protein SPPG_04253 [Spizellomyces punctatus DAOM BR117]|uniref:Uncharacterized protein n=1 Tax=Spizellomyces punctatus (strain DAOM BR117) TaxID=645134 RepID=A0A0L0HJG5_SPIPD|nr:uncharacterized protein SPPG_04253 [Spizellomyces punctatus DAOM BR117]KND01163.1 hypothetical protein SPPG_04253 [Spizellomyces punctatus DAOM BR117]|eukprot:XP_016609202.1 hypothetical protein SPPG_04253 [Spizellomyces punctatus DAOM BR117]